MIARLYQLSCAATVLGLAWVLFTGWTFDSRKTGPDGAPSGGGSPRSSYIFFNGGK